MLPYKRPKRDWNHRRRVTPVMKQVLYPQATTAVHLIFILFTWVCLVRFWGGIWNVVFGCDENVFNEGRQSR